MTKIGQYHLRAPFKYSWKLIRHIRFLVNRGVLSKISHEGTENGDTYVCIILKTRTTLADFEVIEKNLESLGLKMI